VSGEVRVEYPADGVGMVIIHNPPRNMWHFDLAELMAEAFLAVGRSGSRVLVLVSDVPGSFLAHVALDDLQAIREGRAASGQLEAMARCARELRSGPAVSIAAAAGQCWGGGLQLFASANLRVASGSATFGLPEVIMASSAPGNTASRIPRLIGEARAMELQLDGRPISARKALHWGLINRLYGDEEMLPKTLEWAALIASRPAPALQAIKRAILACQDEAAYRDAIRTEREIGERILGPYAHLRAGLEKDIADRYAAGADSWEAWLIPPGDIQQWEDKVERGVVS
jgi:enoyl-CoA hydratase/carnithine racemase